MDIDDFLDADTSEIIRYLIGCGLEPLRPIRIKFEENYATVRLESHFWPERCAVVFRKNGKLEHKENHK